MLANVCGFALLCTCNALQVATSHSWRNLLLFRSRSRHTYGFLPETQFDLPCLELQSLLADQALELQSCGDDSLYWAKGVAESQLVAAVSNSIMTHALFSIVASGHTAGEACVAAAAQVDELALTNVEVIDLDKPMLRTAERLEILAECEHALSESRSRCSSSGGSSSGSSSSSSGSGSSSSSSSSSSGGGGSSSESEDPSISSSYKDQQSQQPWVLIRARDGPETTVHIGIRLQSGPAGGRGAPGRAPRRCYKGLLGTYALKSRSHATAVTMEPELGFLMANLAKVGAANAGCRSSVAVLDPCCGGGGLLLCAAALGATELVGLDSDEAAFAHATHEFAAHGLPAPTLCRGDVIAAADDGTEEGIDSILNTYRSSTSQSYAEEAVTPRLFDAIVCDPPYGMSTPAIIGSERHREGSLGRAHAVSNHGGSSSGSGAGGGGNGDDGVSSSGWAQGTSELTTGRADRLFASALILLAARHLCVGGRLVFFLPVRGSDAERPLEALLASIAPDGMLACGDGEEQHGTPPLVLKPGRLQRFSRTFARWLVCIERADGAAPSSSMPAVVVSEGQPMAAVATTIAEGASARDPPDALAGRSAIPSTPRPRASLSAIRCCSAPSDPLNSPSSQPSRRRASRSGAWTEAQQRAYDTAVSRRVRSRGGHGGDGVAVGVPEAEGEAQADAEAVGAFADLAAADDRRRAWHGEVATASTALATPILAGAAVAKPHRSQRVSQHVCRVCSLTFDRKKQLDEHLRGKKHTEAVEAAQAHWAAFERESWWHEPSLTRAEQQSLVTSAWSLDAFLEGLPSRSRDGGSGLAPHVTLASLAPSKRLMLWRYLRELTPSNPLLPEVFAQLERQGDGRFARAKEILESGETFKHAEQAILRSDPTAVVKRGKVPVTPRAGRTYRPEIRRVVDVACGHGLVGLLLAHRFPTELTVDAIDWVQRPAFAAYRVAWQAAAKAATVEIAGGATAGGASESATLLPPLSNIRFVEGDFTTSVSADVDARPEGVSPSVAPVDGHSLVLCVHGCNEVNVQAVDLAKRADAAWLAVPCCLKAELYMPAAASLRLPDDTRYAFLCGSMAAAYGADRVAALDARITPRAIVLSGGGPEAALAASNNKASVRQQTKGDRAVQAAQLTARGRVSDLPSGQL